MGYDIELVAAGGEAGDQTHEQLYLSYTWSQYDKYWHASSAHNVKGRYVERQLVTALQRLAEEQIFPDDTLGVDGWGCLEGYVMSSDDHEYERLCMFAYHLKQFLNYARRYPDTTWVVR